jgi:hypothetical protein
MLRRLTTRARLAASVLFMALVVMALPVAGAGSVTTDPAERIAASSEEAPGQAARVLPYRGHRPVRHLRAVPRTTLRVFIRVVVPRQLLASGESDLRTRRAPRFLRALLHAPAAPRAPAAVAL